MTAHAVYILHRNLTTPNYDVTCFQTKFLISVTTMDHRLLATINRINQLLKQTNRPMKNQKMAKADLIARGQKIWEWREMAELQGKESEEIDISPRNVP